MSDEEYWLAVATELATRFCLLTAKREPLNWETLQAIANLRRMRQDYVSPRDMAVMLKGVFDN